MQEGFRSISLHGSGVTPDIIRNSLREVPLTDSVKQTLRLLESLPHVDVIIISDANSVFIDIILAHHGVFKTIVTNPAHFDENGVLCVKHHCDSGHDCNLCPANLCKGLALEQYMEKSRPEGIQYGRVVYIGDGQGDFCPCLRLSENDVALARTGYRLLDMLSEERGSSCLQAQLVPWSNGDDLLKLFQTFKIPADV